MESAEYGLVDSINQEFRGFQKSDEEGEIEKRDVDYYYGVIAISEKGSSMLSNVYSREELAANLPYCYAYEKSKEQEGSSARSESVELAPTHSWITMCDGRTVRKRIDYDTSKAEVKMERYYNIDDKGEIVSAEDVRILTIPYSIDGTPFYSELTVMYYDDANFATEMDYLEKRQEALKQKSGVKDVTADENEDFDRRRYFTNPVYRRCEHYSK